MAIDRGVSPLISSISIRLPPPFIKIFTIEFLSPLWTAAWRILRFDSSVVRVILLLHGRIPNNKALFECLAATKLATKILSSWDKTCILTLDRLRTA